MAKELNRHCSKEETQMASKHMKRFLTSLVTREILTTMRYYFTPTRLAIITKRQSQVLVRTWRNWSPHILLMEM